MTQARTPELADIIRQAIEDRLAEVHVMLPGRIDAYDNNLQKADVEPLIRRVQLTVDGEINEALPIVPNVPVVWPRAGGFKITMPVQPGDRCMLVFCERSIEAYQIGQGRKGSSALIQQTDPDTFDMHGLTDPVAVMGWYNDAEALSPAPDSSDMVLGEHGGPVIHIGGDQVNLYEKSGSGHDFVALAQKVLDELQTAKSDRQAIATQLQQHTHLAGTLAAPSGPVTGVTGTANETPPTQTDPQSVAAAKVKAT